jgi:hypothetical protein
MTNRAGGNLGDGHRPEGKSITAESDFAFLVMIDEECEQWRG